MVHAEKKKKKEKMFESASTTHLIDKDNGWRACGGGLEKLAKFLLTFAAHSRYYFGRGDLQKRHSHFVRDGVREHRLATARRPVQLNTYIRHI